MVKVLTIAALLALAGCQTASGSFCAGARPFRVSPQAVDAMTDAQVAAALAHNKKGAALCGWKA